MSNIEIKYTTTHEWAEIIDSEDCTVGITERVQELYTNIIFIELPSLDEFEQDEIIGRLESADGRNFYIHAPVSGEVYEVNTALEDDIDLLNRFPEGDGWICKLHIENPSEIEALLTLKEYDTYEEEELNEEEYLPETDFYENSEDY